MDTSRTIQAPTPVQPLPCSMYPSLRGLPVVLVNDTSGPTGIRGFVAASEIYRQDGHDYVAVVPLDQWWGAELLGLDISDLVSVWPAQAVYVL